MAIDTDYSFLNLPEAGSKAQGPIARPSFDPVDFSFNLDRYAPQNLPDVEMVAPSLPSFSADRNEAVLNSVRPFEDIRTLGATFGQKLAETEKFFGDQVNKLQGNIDDLINTKSDLTKQLEAAFLQQDEMSQQAIEEQIAALDKQRAELTSLLEQKVAEAEANGVDAVAAAEKVASDQRQQFEGQISSLDQQLQDLEISKQEAIAAGDQQRVAELEAQQQQLTQEREQIVSQMEQEFGGERSELEGQITSLDEQLAQLEIDKELAIQQGDEQRVAELEAQQQELTAQRDQIVAQMEQEFGGERSEFEGQISSLEDQLSQLEIDKELAIQAGDEQRVAELEAQEQQLIQQRDELVAQMEQQFGGERGELEARIAEIESAQQAAIAERDQAIAEQDTIRAQAAEQQASALENLKQELLTERAGIVGGLEGTIGDLQGEIDGLTGARDVAISERDQAIAQQDTIRAEAADAQAQALDAQANDYQAQLDELTGQSSQYQTQLGERDQTIADLQAQIAALQGSGQPPADTPTVTDVQDGPPLSYQEFIEAGNKPIDYNAYRTSFGDYKQKPQINIDDYMPPKQPPSKPPQLPPKESDQLFIDDRPTDPRASKPRGKPVGGYVPGGGGINYGGPSKPLVKAGGSKPIQKPISIGGVGGGIPVMPKKNTTRTNPRIGGGIGGFPGKRTGRMIRR